MQWDHDDSIRVTTRRARIVKVDDSGTQQLVDLKGLKNEMPKKIWRVVDYGHFSVPPDDTDGVMVQMGSRSDRTLYFDGGHKDYRPKNRPAGSSGFYDQYGNIIQSDQNQIGFTHGKVINIQLGKGFDAKGAQAYSGPTVSITLNQNSVTVTMGQSSFNMQPGQITYNSPKHILNGEVHLGADGGTLIAGATKVFAV